MTSHSLFVTLASASYTFQHRPSHSHIQRWHVTHTILHHFFLIRGWGEEGLSTSSSAKLPHSSLQDIPILGQYTVRCCPLPSYSLPTLLCTLTSTLTPHSLPSPHTNPFLGPKPTKLPSCFGSLHLLFHSLRCFSPGSLQMACSFLFLACPQK